MKERSTVQTSLLGIAKKAKSEKRYRFRNLYRELNEEDFLACSYGYRPRVGALDAADQLQMKLQFGGYHHVVEADIKGFFDNLSHEWLMRMLAERIDDQAILRLIKKWLKAGVLDTDGKVLRPEGGTPQGGIISPILANVYLHYALDLWGLPGSIRRRLCVRLRTSRGSAALLW